MDEPSADWNASVTNRKGSGEPLLSWLFQKCARLQVALDRRVLDLGLTFQEANALVRCVEAGEIEPGRLAMHLGRDRGRITRLIDRLVTGKLVRRGPHPRDRRHSVIIPSEKGKRLAQQLAALLAELENELFRGVLDNDVRWMARTVSQLQENAARIAGAPEHPAGRKRRGTAKLVSAAGKTRKARVGR